MDTQNTPNGRALRLVFPDYVGQADRDGAPPTCSPGLSPWWRTSAGREQLRR